MNRRSLFRLITTAIVASSMEVMGWASPSIRLRPNRDDLNDYLSREAERVARHIQNNIKIRHNPFGNLKLMRELTLDEFPSGNSPYGTITPKNTEAS